jgi:membrane-associated protease RseP (regulator of RpoE activity)
MDIATQNWTTLAILLAAIGILVWGFRRSQPYGRVGILAWLQSVTLMAPWLLFFGLLAFGIALNIATILLIFLLCTGIYIILGRQIRQMRNSQQSQPPQQTPTSDWRRSEDSPATSESGPDEGSFRAPPAEPTSQPQPTGIPSEDLREIQGLFGIDTFFATETIPYQEGAIFRGNLRSDAETAYQQLSASLQEQMGDRYRLFLVNDREDKPVAIVLPSKNDPQPLSTGQKVLAAVLWLATLGTSVEVFGLLMGFDVFQNPNRLNEVWPLAVGLWLILGVHELFHQIIAKRRGVRMSFPFFIPTWQLGSFGALNRFTSLLPSRQVLFDVAFAGPVAGGVTSLAMLILGFFLSREGSWFQIPSEFFQGSILVGTIAKVTLGSTLQQAVVDIHPLVPIGWLGLVITALNLLPAGQLDGGRIVQAIYGRKIANRTTVATLLFLGVASFFNVLALYWAILILLLQRNLERPCQNDLSEPNDASAALTLLVLFLALATLLPLSPSVAGRLGIGGM